MAQLIKLQDYISRYEQEIYKYPTRYLSLKNRQWQAMNEKWEKRNSAHGTDHSIEKRKQLFLDRLFPLQLKWASSTVARKSFIDGMYKNDEMLKFFLQRFPDTFLIMYRPVFLLKKAMMEGEIIFLTPTAIWCIKVIEQENDDVFIGSKARFWIVKKQNGDGTEINPLPSLERTGAIVKTLMERHDIDLPVHQVILTRNGYIDYSLSPFGIELIDKRNYEEWFKGMRSQRSPLKHAQLKAAKCLLQLCLTTSVKRPEWSERF
ncbi:hypothetical protein [Bacillus massilinigeriensis]|uniref:hypothetical protein n=1 Tax=Bacillus mediterraneensis TaxID=1805474 RepID=UPI0008F88768|nr:hypothetical protein [Bacillus mediterraneensis]